MDENQPPLNMNSKKTLNAETQKKGGLSPVANPTAFDRQAFNRKDSTQAKDANNQMTLMEKLREFGERSTFHGIPSLVSTERVFIRIIWMMCIVASGIYCVYTIAGNTRDFFSYQVETVIEVKHEANADFPTVTFCSNLICDLPEYSYSDLLDTYYRSLPNRTDDKDLWMNSTKLRDLNEYARETYIDKLIKDGKQALLYQNTSNLKSMLISCLYNNEFCSESDFEFFQLSEFQKCYKFNARPMVNGTRQKLRFIARRYGKTYGLQLELYIGLPDKCKTPFNTAEGVVLYVQNNTYNITSDSNGIELAPGSETNIAIDRTLILKKSQPYSDCIEENKKPSDSNEYIDLTFSLFGYYSQPTCVQLCYQRWMIKRHGCQDRYLPLATNLTDVCPLIVTALNNTIFTNKTLFYQDPNNDVTCNKMCREQCESMIYDTSVSNSLFPTKTYSEILVRNENISSNYDKYGIDLDEPDAYWVVRNSVLAVNVFYQADFYTRIKEKAAIEYDVYISNIGGALGLFLGISILSFIEIFELLVEVIDTLCGNNKKINKITTFNKN